MLRATRSRLTHIISHCKGTAQTRQLALITTRTTTLAAEAGQQFGARAVRTMAQPSLAAASLTVEQALVGTQQLLQKALSLSIQQRQIPDSIAVTVFMINRHGKKHARLTESTHWSDSLVKAYHVYSQQQLQQQHDPAAAATAAASSKLHEWTESIVRNAQSILQSTAATASQSAADSAMSLTVDAPSTAETEATAAVLLLLSPLLSLQASAVTDDHEQGCGVIDITLAMKHINNTRSQRTAMYTPFLQPASAATLHKQQQSQQQQQSFDATSIGTIQSCYRLKYGTQRQGSVVCGSSRATLTLHSHIDEKTLEGLSEYSHIWLLFVFDDNGNKSFHATVQPPRLLGERTGVFSTRSPHRINPIGLTCVRLLRVVGRVLHLAGIDLIDNTPVLDIKIIHPCEQLKEFTVPQWTLTTTATAAAAANDTGLEVIISDEANQQLIAATGGITHISSSSHSKLQFYDTHAEIREALIDVFALDIRPYWHRNVNGSSNNSSSSNDGNGQNNTEHKLKPMLFDRLQVSYRVNDSTHVCTITHCELLTDKQIAAIKQQEATAFNKYPQQTEAVAVTETVTNAAKSSATAAAAAAGQQQHDETMADSESA